MMAKIILDPSMPYDYTGLVTCRLDLGMEVKQNPTELWISTEIGEGSMSTRDEDALERLELVVGDGIEWPRMHQVVLELHLLDQLRLFVFLPPHAHEGEGC
jgi:hypothetical protein